MNKILVVADFLEDEQIAITRACELAKIYDASLHIVHFCFVNLGNDLDNLESIKSKVIDNTRSQAEQQLKERIGETIPYTHDVEWCKHIWEWVNAYINVEHPVLVVKTGSRSESILYTPTDWRILRESAAPVYIAHDPNAGRGTSKQGKSILAAVDLETRHEEKKALNEHILHQAKRIADAHSLQLHVCYVPPCPAVLKDLGLRFPDEVELEANNKLKDTLSDLAARYDMAPDHIHVKAGEAEKIIPSLANKAHANLVVIGSVGRTGLKAKIIGNTAEKTMARLRTDILALKP